MKIAVITDSSAFLEDEYKNKENLFTLDIPIVIDGETYFEGKNLSNEDFYKKMSETAELPKTSQPSVAELEELLANLEKEDYTHVIGLFLSRGISGFYQNSFYLQNEFPNLVVKFFDTLITSAPLGYMVEIALNSIAAGDSFEEISQKLDYVIEKTRAYILVDDLKHLVKGGRLSNGAAIVGNLLSIKPILEFNREGQIVVYDKVRSSKKALKKLISIVKEASQEDDYQVFVIHSNARKLAEDVAQTLEEDGLENISIATVGAIIGTHLGENAIVLAISPVIK
ncbi:DegV family protein [Streptococcaceae bacterium ESL0729]|nr:DegV family protein [Streptococcaceae bacterium ESL0729]